MNRREILKGVLAGASAGAVTAQTAEHAEHAVRKEAATQSTWKPLLFDDHQNQTVVRLSELIIPKTDTPGAREARVNEYIDLILKEGATERSARFLQGLGWLDGYAIRQHASPFVKCGEAQQIAMLRTLDGAPDGELRPGAEFFRQVKQLTVQGYYTSKIGIDELNKGGRIPGSFGCVHEGSR